MNLPFFVTVRTSKEYNFQIFILYSFSLLSTLFSTIKMTIGIVIRFLRPNTSQYNTIQHFYHFIFNIFIAFFLNILLSFYAIFFLALYILLGSTFLPFTLCILSFQKLLYSSPVIRTFTFTHQLRTMKTSTSKTNFC